MSRAHLGSGEGESADERSQRRPSTESHVDSNDEHGAKKSGTTPAKILAWRNEFKELTGISPVKTVEIKEWQAAHGVPATGLIRHPTITAARAAIKEKGPTPEDGSRRGEAVSPEPREDSLVEHAPLEPEGSATLSSQSGEPLGANSRPRAAVAEKTHDKVIAAETGAPAKHVAITPNAQLTASSTLPTKLDAKGIDSVTDRTEMVDSEILRGEEIFRDVGPNTVAKKKAFNNLNAAWKQQRQGERLLAEAKTPKARQSAETALAKSKLLVAAETEQLEEFVLQAHMGKDKQLKNMKKQRKALDPKKDAEKCAKLDAAISSREEELRKDVESMEQPEKGHDGESVFQPESTKVTHHDFAFPDGEHVKLRDHAVSYATTAPLGVDSEDPTNHDEVKTVMASAGLSDSKRNILQAISGFEGGFDTVNTYDRAKVTWGFVQWTGGNRSDLTKAMTVIKDSYPKAFAKSFQAYGIDVVKDQLVITPPDGAPPVVGDAAAEAIMRNPKLAAALAHAGRDEDVKKGEVKAAAHIEIDTALSMSISAGGHRTTAGELITSEYGVALLANTYVHSGSGAASKFAHAALATFVADHPYQPNDPAWAAEAETSIVTAFAQHDSDRAAALKKKLKSARGSYQP